MAKMKEDNLTPLAKLRIKSGLSREDASSILNVVMMTLYRYENGITDIPLGIAEDMASLYKVSFNELRDAAKATKQFKGINTNGRVNTGRKQKIQKLLGNNEKDREIIDMALQSANNLN